MHYEIKRRANKLNSNHYEDLSKLELDRLINESQVFLMEHIGEANQLPFESNQQRMDILSSFVVKYGNKDYQQPELDPVLIEDGLYELDYNLLRFDYAHTVRAFVKCNDRIIQVIFKRHDELSSSLDDEYQKPSVQWDRILGTLGKSSNGTSLYLYVPTGVTLSKVRVEYLKKPRDVFSGGYDTLQYVACKKEGLSDCSQFYSSTDSIVHSEVNEHYHDLIVDIAVYLFTGETENINLMQIKERKLQQIK